jgi:hypothetical protein
MRYGSSLNDSRDVRSLTSPPQISYRPCERSQVPRAGPDDPAYAWPMIRMPGLGGLPWINDRAKAEAHIAVHRPEVAEFRAGLYARERALHYRVGTCLFYQQEVRPLHASSLPPPAAARAHRHHATMRLLFDQQEPPAPFRRAMGLWPPPRAERGRGGGRPGTAARR